MDLQWVHNLETTWSIGYWNLWWRLIGMHPLLLLKQAPRETQKWGRDGRISVYWSLLCILKHVQKKNKKTTFAKKWCPFRVGSSDIRCPRGLKRCCGSRRRTSSDWQELFEVTYLTSDSLKEYYGWINVIATRLNFTESCLSSVCFLNLVVCGKSTCGLPKKILA